MSGSAAQKVGVVGLGAMGRPIAEHVARAGFDVLAYDLAPNASADGVVLVDSLSEVATADAVIVIVPTDEDVTDVVAGKAGLIANGHEDLIIVLSASLRPDTCRHLADIAAQVGIHVIDAALTGGVRGAESGRLNLLVGGDPAVVERVRGVFMAFATGYHVLGGIGAGQVGKSASNLIHWAQIVAIDEALRLAESLGVEPNKLRRALQDGPADSRALREIELMRFTWYVKDIAVAQAMAGSVGRALPVAELSRRLMDDITVATVHELLARRCPESEVRRRMP
jgi:3-hydroxyisobutyrate dehydrogenase-like beta-hydroxyacid dehydrogenase